MKEIVLKSNAPGRTLPGALPLIFKNLLDNIFLFLILGNHISS